MANEVKIKRSEVEGVLNSALPGLYSSFRVSSDGSVKVKDFVWPESIFDAARSQEKSKFGEYMYDKWNGPLAKTMLDALLFPLFFEIGYHFENHAIDRHNTLDFRLKARDFAAEQAKATEEALQADDDAKTLAAIAANEDWPTNTANCPANLESLSDNLAWMTAKDYHAYREVLQMYGCVAFLAYEGHWIQIAGTISRWMDNDYAKGDVSLVENKLHYAPDLGRVFIVNRNTRLAILSPKEFEPNLRVTFPYPVVRFQLDGRTQKHWDVRIQIEYDAKPGQWVSWGGISSSIRAQYGADEREVEFSWPSTTRGYEYVQNFTDSMQRCINYTHEMEVGSKTFDGYVDARPNPRSNE